MVSLEGAYAKIVNSHLAKIRQANEELGITDCPDTAFRLAGEIRTHWYALSMLDTFLGEVIRMEEKTA